jgi:hypothetical protein
MNIGADGLLLYESPYMPPDFYRISDWHNPRETAEPEWMRGIVMGNALFAHPSVIKKIKERGEQHTLDLSEPA